MLTDPPHHRSSLLYWQAMLILADYYRSKYEMKRAAELLSCVLMQQERQLGFDHYQCAETLWLSACVARDLQKNEDFRQLSARALGIFHRCAEQCRLGGDRREAERLYRRALALGRDILPLSDKLGSVLLNNLGLCCQSDQEALLLHLEAVALADEYSPDYSHLGVLLKNLAAVHFKLGSFEQAEAELLRALSLAEKEQQDNSVLDCLTRIVPVLERQRKFAPAEDVCKRALGLVERQTRSAYGELSSWTNQLARLRFEQGRFVEAELTLSRVLRYFEDLLGSDHKEIVAMHDQLARIRRVQGKTALPAPAVSLQPSEFVQSYAAGALASANDLRAHCRYGEAIAVLQIAVSSLQTCQGEDCFTFVDLSYNLALLHLESNNFEQAELTLRQTINEAVQAFGQECPLLVRYIRVYGRVLRMTGRLAESQYFWSCAEAIDQLWPG